MLCNGYLSYLVEMPTRVRQVPVENWEEGAENILRNLQNYSRVKLISAGEGASPITWKRTESYYKMLKMLKDAREFEIYNKYKKYPETGRYKSFTFKILSELGLELGEEKESYDFLTDGSVREKVFLEHQYETEMSDASYKLSKNWFNLQSDFERELEKKFIS